MDDSTTATPSPSSAAATAAGYDAARDKTSAGVTAAVSSSVRLLIKSSNQQYDDINIESDLCWTVQRLKKQLSLVYPGKPEINDQKLIYSGKLLDDAQKLSEVIRSYKDVYQQHHIFHLVCANKNIIKASYKATTPPKDTATSMPRLDTNTNDNELRQRHAANANANTNAAAAAAAAQMPYQQQANATHPWLQLQNQANQLAQMAAQAQAQAQAQASSTATTSTNQQLAFQQQQALLYNAWVQQWYAAYMQQMLQRISTSDESTPPPMLRPLLQGPFPVIPNNLNAPYVGHHQAVPVPVAAAAAVAAAGAPNEGAAAVQQPEARQVDAPNFRNIQEEPEIRDWLDRFFIFTRMALFISVLYFNSSPMRCLLVVLIASIIYLYHIGVLRRRRERNNNNINRNNNAGNDIAAFAAVQQIQRMMDAAVEGENNAPEAAPAVAPGQDANAQAEPAAAADPVAPTSADQPDAAAAAAEAVAVEQANPNNSVISIVRTFVITFFTSLLPEAPAL